MMSKCSRIYDNEDEICNEKECKFWIDFEEECNCMNVSIKRNGNMTLDEVGLRLGISHVRVKQIQDRSMNKMKIFMNDAGLAE
jgi:hypothetical protein